MQKGEKTHLATLLEDRTPMALWFVPTYENRTPISSALYNLSILKTYIESDEWKDLMEYLFGYIRPNRMPFYTPEMYYLDKIKTVIKAEDAIIKIGIAGILRKHSYDNAKKIYENCGAPNKTWSDESNLKLSGDNFYQFIGSGFVIWTQESEMLIEDIGKIVMSWNTQMELEI
jgi:hypothetical protein